MSIQNSRWYLGAMNDGLFIIDQPPQPGPVDYVCTFDHDVNVIAAMGTDRAKAEAIIFAHNRIVDRYVKLQERARIRATELAEGLA